MSAINPASFAAPSAGLQAPSGVGPGAVGVRNVVPDRRLQQQQDQAQQYGNNRNYGAGYGQSFPAAPVSQALVPQPQQQMYPTASNEFTYGYTPFAAAPRSMNPMGSMNGPMASFNPGMMQQHMDPFSSPGFVTPPNYQQNTVRYPSPHGGMLQDDYGRQSNVGGEGWMSSFQGLSLNSR